MTDQPPEQPGPQPGWQQGAQPGGQPGWQPGWQPGPQGWQPAYAPPPPAHPQAITVLVLGILGVVLCQAIGPFAWVMGNRVVAEIDAARGAVGGRTETTIGRVLGIVSTAMLCVALGFLLLFLVGNVALLAGLAGFASS